MKSEVPQVSSEVLETAPQALVRARILQVVRASGIRCRARNRRFA